ncbi:uncharacterized protein B0T15DRAFT_575675 [Chaetomium strumarium]|uniref:Uncharacterized protein n=1 Tax=Chaetomium strumarium TaxID=1170767 RepID=A0AAJ0M073_9PEZI|nr:hypothetical protein B0T15DRAFT_575675 [Chaetomium strumarium]
MSQSRADTLRAHLGSANAIPRPILTSLNGNNSWLISFPGPASKRARPGSKLFSHIVSDPWLSGHAELITSWMMTIRTEEAAIGSSATTEQPPLLDAIFLNFHHGIPVFATPEAAAIVQRWGYFSHVTETLDLDPAAPANTWPSLHPGGGLPHRLNVFRLQGHHELNFATAIVYSSSPPEEGKMKKHEALLCSPHGIKTDQAALTTFLENLDEPESNDSNEETSRISVLVILHALKDNFSFGMRFMLGVAGGLALERLARPRYWVKSHEAPLAYTRIVPFLARVNDVPRTLQSGLDGEKVNGGGGGGGGEIEDREGRKVVDVPNGACFVLGLSYGGL